VEEILPDEVDKAIINTIKGQEGIKMSQTVKKGISTMAWEGGEAAGGAKMIIRYLGRRFRTVPKPVKDKVCSITDTNRLGKLMDKAADCQSLDEFAEALK
jgi:hypothetical protein